MTDQADLSDAADVVSLAFANDPLIQWLRPTSKDRDEVLAAATLRCWQVRRLQRFQLYGMLLVIHDSNELQSAAAMGAKLAKANDHKSMITSSISAVALIEPIHMACVRGSTFDWWLQWLKYQWNELVNPVEDKAADVQRVDVMLQTHNDTMAFLEEGYDLSNAYYLEVAAVHPARQGKRFGRRIMEMVLAKTKGATLVLECTTLENIEFYKKFGFDVVRECNLSTLKSEEQGDTVSIWVMIRQPEP